MAMGIPKNQLQRVSPGVYRNAQGGLQNPRGGVAPSPVVNRPAVKPPPTGGPSFVDRGQGTNQPNPQTPAPNMESLNNQRSQILNEIHRRGGIPKAGGFATKLNEINTQIRGLRNPQASIPAGETPAPDQVTPPPGDQAIAPDGNIDPNANDDYRLTTDAATKSLYPSMNYQLPENYEGSPMYKWQMQQGNQALNRKLAQRGLLDSGAELEATNRLSQSVGAQESDRLRGDFQTEADRFERVSANEANRLRDQENNAWSRRMDLFDRLNKQSPMNEAYNGMGQYSNLDMKQGQARASNTANNYKRVSGGGRQSAGTFTPPPASGPDYSQIDLINSLFGNSQSKNNGNIFDSGVGSLSGFFK